MPNDKNAATPDQADVELTLILKNLTQRGGGCRLIVVTGEPGSGKTQLIENAVKKLDGFVKNKARTKLRDAAVEGPGKVVSLADPLELLVGLPGDINILKSYLDAPRNFNAILLATTTTSHLTDSPLSPELRGVLAMSLHQIRLSGKIGIDQLAVKYPKIPDLRTIAGGGEATTSYSDNDFIGFTELREELEKLVKLMLPGGGGGNCGGRLLEAVREKVTPSGILLTGVTGCGKTALGKDLCRRAEGFGVSVRWVDGSSVFGAYLGETEERVREIFKEARASSPCIVVIDNLDALGRRREGGGDDADSSSTRSLSSLLCELDGIGGNAGVMPIGLTSLPWHLDSALLRQGRFEKFYTIPPPSPPDRLALLQRHLPHLTTPLPPHTPASINSIVRSAKLLAIAEGVPVQDRHLEAALTTHPPPPTPHALARYTDFTDAKK